jgi:hypothetical protein
MVHGQLPIGRVLPAVFHGVAAGWFGLEGIGVSVGEEQDHFHEQL